MLQVVLLGLLVTQDPGPIDRRSVGRHRLMVALLVVMTLGTVVSVTVLAVNILAGVEGVTATVLFGPGRGHPGWERGRVQPVVPAAGPWRAY